ncbi:MAG TPA: gamma-glutamyl-gamma-aminobutyrate hydrolase family protein [Candidatus Limnocylindrales bacterium]
MVSQPESAALRVVVTVSVAADDPDPALARRKHERYADAVRRHGGEPLLLDAALPFAGRARALAGMDGLVLAGGVDLHPARYGQPLAGTRHPEPARDDLEAEAWAAAAERALPVLGICRGLQAINVFLGGSLLQHVDGHAGPPWGQGPALCHPIRLLPDTRLRRLLGADAPATLEVNSYHHQAVRPADLAPGLVAAALAASPEGDLVEALEAPGGRFVVGLQCHPERTESSPPELERIWAAFVGACRR